MGKVHGDSRKLHRRSSWFERLNFDPVLFPLLVVLCLTGLFALYSGSGGNGSMVVRQGGYMFVGFILMSFIARIPPRTLARLAMPIFIGSCLLLVAVLVLGYGAKGAQRWLSIGGFRFQPSEAVKLAVPMVTAWYLAKTGVPPKFMHLLASLCLVLIPVGMVALQPDLGTSLIVAASGLSVILLGGLSWKLVAGMGMLSVPLALGVWHFYMHDYQKERVMTFLNPESDPLGAGWNIIQSKAAIGSGGLSGKGWLEGTQAQLDFLPESHTDFIIAVFGEEFGFYGCLFLVVLYLLITLRGMQIAFESESTFGKLCAGSITMTFFLYVFINVGMVSGLLPVVGVPLPLVSRGGTSLLSLMAGFGVLMSVSAHRGSGRYA